MKTANTQSCRTARNLLLSFAAAAALAATGGEVTAERAVNATSAWIAHSTAPSRLPTGDVRTFSLNGTNVFHLVALRGGGWVAMPADDAYESILAFSFDEDAELPDEDDGCPGWGFLAYCAGMDVMTSPNGSAGEDDAFDNGHVCGGDRPFFTIMPSMTPPRLTERDTSDSTNAEPGRSIGRKSLDAGSGRLQATKSVNALKGEDEQLDIRVPSFVKSRWSQSTAQSKYCYNYYTPEHSVCGCVATAMAQVMRHFEWPASNVVMPMTNVQHRISYRGETIVTNFISGAFDWSKMPYNPGKKSNLTDEECEMIGRLTFDCGVSLGMDYDSGGSSPDSANGGNSTRGGLKNDFGYGHGCYIGSVSAANIKNSLLPSLDAKRPASCSIPGHMVVADGYAFKNGELYIHLNMGWGGLSDAYYSAFGGSSNRHIGSAHYNLTTNGTVRIASGRVTDQNGAPLSGVTVYAKVLMSGETTPTSQTVTTDDYGIYAVETPSGMHSIDISAEKEGYVSLCESLTAATSSEDAGNSWGNDFVLVAWNSTCEWTGDGDGTTFGDGDNWDCGVAPTNCATLVFGAETPSFVTNDIPDFTPAAIVFLPECPKVEIGGLGLQDVVAMASSAAERPVFATEVAFADTIDVNGAMEFRGGVQGTYPVHHNVYYGDYRLTATEWTLSSAITVAEGSSLIAPDTTITETAAQLICGEAGSKFKAKELVYHTIKGYAFGPFAGEADIGKIDFDKVKWYGFGPDFTGTLRVGGLHFYSTPESGAEGDCLRFYSNGRFVIGSENGDSYLMGSRGTFNLREADATEPLVLNSAADWYMIAVAPGAGARLGHGFSIDAQGVVIDTSDFDGAETGHTVTVTKSGNPASVLKGSGYLAATGNGTLKFDASCTFSGGLVASNGVTLALADGVTPGNGDVTMAGGTTLAVPSTMNCTATVAGAFNVAEGYGSPVNVCIGSATNELAKGQYKVVAANEGFGGGVSAASFALANPMVDGAVAMFEIAGNELWLNVVDAPDHYVWAGGSSGANWTAADKWTLGGAPATWVASDYNTATFSTSGDLVTVDEQVSVSRVNFNANATINGTATLSVSSVSVVPNVSATISAPTDGALTKSGTGTLTLGSSRVDQTTLDEGTIAMANGATLDSSKLTLGTDVAKPVALDYAGQAMSLDFSARSPAGTAAGGTVTLANGEFTIPATLRVWNGSLTLAQGAHVALETSGNRWVCVGGNNAQSESATDVDARLVLDGGSITNNTGKHLGVGDFGTAPSKGEFVVKNGGSYWGKSNIIVAQGCEGHLVVDGEGSSVTASALSFCGETRDEAGENGYVVVTNGGVLAVKSVGHGNGGAEGYLRLDGGTLRAAAAGTLLPANDRLHYEVGALGGTIDNGGFNVTLAQGLEGDGTVAFSGAGTTTLGAGVAIAGSASVATGATLAFAETATISGALTLEGGSTLAFANPSASGSAVSVGSLSAASPVNVVLTGVAADSRYALISGVGAGCETAFKVASSPVPGTFAVESGTLYFVPFDGFVWTGAGSDSRLGNPANWFGGVAPTAGGEKLNFNADADTTVVCDIDGFSPSNIVIVAGSAKFTFEGETAVTNLVSIECGAGAEAVFNLPVRFAENVDKSGSGIVRFAAGAWGALPVNHSVFYGVYHLTAEKWTLSSAVTIAEDSSLLAPGTSIDETAAKLICGEAGSRLKARELVYHTIKGYAFGPFAGEADIGKIDFDKKKWYGFGLDFTGTLRVGGLYFYSTPESGSEGDYLRFYSNGRFVIGSENGDSYLMGSRGTFNLREADAMEPLVLNSAADWDMIAVAPRAGARLGHGFAIDSQGVVIDTSDFDGGETGHTVTVKKSGNPESVIKGAGYLAATGNGTLKFDASCAFTGGLVASNGVTVALANGVTPGNGDLTMEGGTTLALPDTKNCTATVAGTFRIAEGDSQQVNVRIGAATTELARGNYRLLTANGGFGEGVSAASFALANPTASGAVTTFELNGGELWLSVVVPGDYVWADGSSGANWTAADKWTFGGESATWSALDGNTATFASDGDTATVDEQVSVSRVNFNANATINGTATLSVPSVSVVPNVSATISAPTAGALAKSGAGTLTLGSSRVDQTTLSEGTLAMANGATLDSSKLTLGTDGAKPVAFDYGGQTLTANPTAYLGAGMDVTLTNGVFKNSSDIKFVGSSIPSVLTIAKGATMQTDNRFNWNSTVGTNTINVVGGTVKSKANSNNWIMQNTRTGRLDVNVTDGGLLEFGGETYMLTCRDGDNDYQSPELNMRVVDSAVRVKNGKSLRLGYDDDTKSSATPVFSLVATNSVFDVGWGFNLGNGNSGLPTAGSYTAEFEDTVITARFFRVYKDRTLNHASFNGSAIVFNSGSGGIIAMDDDAKWITVGAKGLTLDTNGMNNEVKANLGGDGAVTKAGAGKLTITKDQTATGGFICAAGETALDAGVTIVARPVTVKDGAKFTVNGTATKSVVSLALEAGSTLDLNGFASDVAAFAVTSFAAPTAGTATLKRNGAAFQSGEYVILEKDGVTAADAENLVPVVENGASYSYSVAGGKLILSVTTYDFPSAWHGGKKVDDAMLAKFHAWRAKYAVSEFQEDYEDAFLLGVDPADDCQIKISSISITGDGPDQVVTIQTDNDFSLINGRLLVRSFSSLGEPTRSDISAVVTSAGAVRLGDDKSSVIGLDGSAPTRFYKLVVDYGDGE